MQRLMRAGVGVSMRFGGQTIEEGIQALQHGPESTRST
jgi:hypothetical protein